MPQGDRWLDKCQPEEQGIPSDALLNFVEALEEHQAEVHGWMVIRNNHLVAEGWWAPFRRDQAHRLYSAAKAVCATAVLFALQEGLIALNTRVVDIFPQYAPASGTYWDELTVFEMLTMTTGHAEDTAGYVYSQPCFAKAFFEIPLTYRPGTHFLYNNGVPYMLGAIIYEMTGLTLMEYLQPRLFKPLGMEGFRCAQNAEGLDEPSTMCATTEDLAKLSLLFLWEGQWNGQEILKSQWAKMAGMYQVPSLQNPEPPAVAYDTKFGYGFQIWRNSVGGFRLDGGRGQFGIVIPEVNLVVAIQSNEEDQGLIPELFWKTVYNRLHSKPIKEDEKVRESQLKLQAKLQNLTLIPRAWATHSSLLPVGEKIVFQMQDKFLGALKIALRRSENEIHLMLAEAEEEKWLAFGLNGKWIEGKRLIEPVDFPFGKNGQLSRIAGLNGIIGYDPAVSRHSAGWENDNTLRLYIRYDAYMIWDILTITLTDNKASFVWDRSDRANVRRRSKRLPQPTDIDHMVQAQGQRINL